MKKSMALFFVLAVVSVALGAVTLSVDAMSLDTLLLDGMRIDGSVGFEVRQLELTFPFRYGKSYKEDLSYAETGVLVKVRPVEEWSLFVEVSFVKLGWLWGIYAPQDQLFLSSEGAVGWDFRLSCLRFSPRVTFRNTLSSEMEKNEALKAIPQFSPYRFSLLMGVEL